MSYSAPLSRSLYCESLLKAGAMRGTLVIINDTDVLKFASWELAVDFIQYERQVYGSTQRLELA